MTENQQIPRIGLDIGSVNAKLVVLCDAGTDCGSLCAVQLAGSLKAIALPAIKVQGNPFAATGELLRVLARTLPGLGVLPLQITGSQGHRVSEHLRVPWLNEFTALGRGALALVPSVRTILEIGGDVSRYINLNSDGDLRIRDYERNGECAAGTGSFIDQQAARLRLKVEQIGALVEDSNQSANIAGRCAVFAKSDMVHAQQRGYDVSAILKGLCEAVVRNYKGTVLRGKELAPDVLFVGGVAANSAVVEAMKTILDLPGGSPIIPPLFQHVAALGCALDRGGAPIALEDLAARCAAPVLATPQTARTPRLRSDRVRVLSPRQLSSGAGGGELYLGLDIGSVSTNLVLVNGDGDVVEEVYTRTDGRPVDVVRRELARLGERWGDRITVRGAGATGSGRELIGELVGADAVHDEITAHKTGASHIARIYLKGEVDTIFEIGGQDAKFIAIDRGVVVDFSMNDACAAGTGSFLEEQAEKLGISITKNFAALALASHNPVKMGERCTVFMEKDVTAFARQGVDLKDICAGLAYAVVLNYLNRVVRGRPIGDNIYFQGGTAYNHAVAAAFSTLLDKTIIVPPHNGVMGAIGAALLARDRIRATAAPTRFRGFDLNQVSFSIRHFTCHACSNRCAIQECTVEGEKTYWGDKCSQRYRVHSPAEDRAIIPDLNAFYQQLLMRDVPGPDGLGLRIGMPRTLTFYDRFPFWRTYFSELGAELVLSEPTNRRIVSMGREACLSEPCFPIIVGFGHVVDLLQREADYLFLPSVIDAENGNSAAKSWYCPWGQTFPLIVKNTLSAHPNIDRLLSPLIHFREGPAAVARAMRPVARKLGLAARRSDRAVEAAFAVQKQFRSALLNAGANAMRTLGPNSDGIVIVGRPYNLYDPGINLNVPDKLRTRYGMNVIPMDFLPLETVEIDQLHDNMFWNYGRRILQAALYVGRNDRLHMIYITNFKCGPDSYIKHFAPEAARTPFLTLQFDDHSNDAGIFTRCEAYLQSKGLLAGTGSRVPATTHGVIR